MVYNISRLVLNHLTVNVMTKDKLFIYPDKKFADDAQLELRKLKDIVVLVRAKFARFILIRAIDSWPRLLNDVDRVRSTKKEYFQISMTFLPKLWFIHLFVITSGYIMNYHFDEDGVIVIYTHL